MKKFIATTVGALVVAFALSGCITIQLPAGNGAGQSDPRTITCEGSQVISESGTYTLTERCPNLSIEANDVTLDADEVVNLDIQGDRVTVQASAVTTVVIGGNSNTVDILALSDAQVAGDRNSVRTSGTLDRAVVNGNDNRIAADGGIAATYDNGERTDFGTEVDPSEIG